jgi:hypothetical protein
MTSDTVDTETPADAATSSAVADDRVADRCLFGSSRVAVLAPPSND